MHHIHLLEDGCSIVSDQDFPSAILDHLVHSSWTETCSDAVSDGWIGEMVPLAAWMLVDLTSLAFSLLLKVFSFSVSDIF